MVLPIAGVVPGSVVTGGRENGHAELCGVG
ncbi:MAG: hypothetical protein QOG20_4105, partial [Pseudonocardiales bacterium]|nr:hypothetical protein [Pseudonocardiales bacterium]